jgi:hypothetical protein
MTKQWISLAVFFFSLMPAEAASVRAKLVEAKAALMSADYRADVAKLASLRSEVAQLANDPDLGYLADYWSGFASWRMVVNGVSAKMPAEEAIGHLGRAVTDFESSIRKKSDFADGYAGAAAMHGWLGAYKSADQAAMKQEIETFHRMLTRALELEPSNPRVLWIEAVPFMVMPAERGGNVDRAIELYQKMIENAAPPRPDSPLPDWGKPEALMSLAGARLKKPTPDVNAAADDARAALRLQPEWHYVKDILLPRIEARRKQAEAK